MKKDERTRTWQEKRFVETLKVRQGEKRRDLKKKKRGNEGIKQVFRKKLINIIYIKSESLDIFVIWEGKQLI